ncbi:MAG: DUF1631 family protein [Burkholderiales bacterium]
MPIAPLLQRFVEDELARAPALIERTLAGTLQLLRNSNDNTLHASERGLHFALVEALQSGAAAYQRGFVDALRVQVQDALNEQQGGWAPGASGGLGTLELMDESRVEVDIEISRAMQLIDTTAEWELRELQTFTSTLLGQTHVSADSNPMRPLLYATALWDAACLVVPTPVHRATLLRVSAGVTAGLLKNAWAAACTRLESQGVVPSIYRTVMLAPGDVPERRPDFTGAPQPGAMAALLASMPTGWAGERAGASGVPLSSGRTAPATAGGLGPEFEQALARLDELLRHLPEQPAAASNDSAAGLAKRLNMHRAALIASASAGSDRQVIELMSRVFDALVADPLLRPEYRSVLIRLQVPALRAALSDPQVLGTNDHAIWSFIDRIGQASALFPQAADPRARALLDCCQGLAERLAQSGAASAEAWRGAWGRLGLFLTEQLQSQLHAAQATLEALERAERRELLEQTLSKRLVDQMVPMRTSPTVRRFVTGAWAKVIAEAMLRYGEQAEPTRGYIKLVDELLWSVQLPDHPQSRQRLLSLLPTLLQRLRAGMTLVNLPAPEQQTVLDELMAIHTEALRPGTRGGATALTPEEIVQRMRDEVLPPTTGHGAFSDSVIDLSSMETVPAEMLPTQNLGDEADDPAKRIEALRAGDALRLFLRGRWTRVQLLWRSDHSLYFLFADELPGRTHSVTRRALERLGTAGLLQALEEKPLVQRATDSLLRELSLNA